MMKPLHLLALWLTTISAGLCLPNTVFAVLGGTEDTVEADRTAISATAHGTISRSDFSVHEFATGATTIREYVSKTGVVFGVAWNGLSHPNLDQLLGNSYAKDFHAGDKKPTHKAGRRRHTVKTKRLVVERWGLMRNLKGRAYDPSLLPVGVTANDIK